MTQQQALVEAINLLAIHFPDLEPLPVVDDVPPRGVWIAEWQKQRCRRVGNCQHELCHRYR